jgi:hypothetical protein
MNESARRGRAWTENELILFVDMYVNGDCRDSHDHDDLARYLGRYNPHAGLYRDGAVNRKLAEIAGEIDPGRRRQHASGAIVRLVRRYRIDHTQLRTDAIAACRAISRSADGPIPEYVQSLLIVRE